MFNLFTAHSSFSELNMPDDKLEEALSFKKEGNELFKVRNTKLVIKCGFSYSQKAIQKIICLNFSICKLQFNEYRLITSLAT